MLNKKVKIALRILLAVVLFFVCLVIGVYVGYNYVLSQNTRLDSLKASVEDGSFHIDKDTPGAVPIVIETGDLTSDIASKLEEAGLVNNTLIFSLMSKINGFDGAYLTGTHYLIEGLAYDEIMYLLTLKAESVVITFPEGITYEEIKRRLHDAGLTFSDAELDECMDSPNLFVDYDFVSSITITEGRDHVLSGYLFPDTYEFDINATPREIINTFLRNTDAKLYEEYYERAESLNMSLDEIITLASLIQHETASVTDMMYISAVFHNRLKSDDYSLHYLGSDASINFLRELNGLEPHMVLTAEDLAIDSPYNTFTHPGLTPGPICMPSIDAIQAALYPEPNCNYYYFCATGDGGTAFAVTLEEHEANVALYSSIWAEQDMIAEGITPTPVPEPEDDTTEG